MRFRTKKYGAIPLWAFEINVWREHTRFRVGFLRSWKFAFQKPFFRRGVTGLNTALSPAGGLTICTVLRRDWRWASARLVRFIHRRSGVGGLVAQNILTPIF